MRYAAWASPSRATRGQRPSIAAALLGDPGTVILDEPINGLDPEGVRQVRNLLKPMGHRGCTVFLSSRLMSELSPTAKGCLCRPGR